MTFRVLKRGTKQLNLYLRSFYLSTTIGGVINMVYATIFNEFIVYIMHFITYYLFCYSLAFILIFILILIKPANQVNSKIQLLILIFFGLLILGLLFIPSGIIISENTNWKPNWSWGFFVYSIIVCSGFTITPTTY